MADAIRLLDTYFSDPAHHSGDKDHVTRDDFAAARGKLGAEADQLIDALVLDGDAYDAVRGCVKEGAFGWFNDSDVSMADLHKAASADAPKTLAGRLASAVQKTQALGSALPAARRFRDIPREMGNSSLGWVENAGQVQALLAVSPPDVVARYKALGTSGINFGWIDNASLVRFMLARGGDRVVDRYRDLMKKHGGEFGWIDDAAVAAAVVASGPEGTYERFAALGHSGLNFGWIEKATVARAVVAAGGSDAEARFRALDSGNFGWVEEEGLARAILAAGPADALERYRKLGDSGLQFGWIENAGVTRALLAVSDDRVVDRYRALSGTGLSFGWVDQAGVAQAEVARGEVFAALPGVPGTESDKN